MPEEQRTQALEEGIPTDKGVKSCEDATQKEINDWRRRATQAEQARQQAERQVEQARKSEQIATSKYDEASKGKLVTSANKMMKIFDELGGKRTTSSDLGGKYATSHKRGS